MAAALSTMPTIAGLTLPTGCTSVKVKSTASDPNASGNKVDVTTLSSTARVYQDAPLIDAGTSTTDGITQTVSASFFGTPPSVNTSATATGWVCTEVEEEYAVNDMIKGTATYVYKSAS